MAPTINTIITGTHFFACEAGFGPFICCVGAGGEGTWVSGVPHCWQNLPVVGFSVPHLGHNLVIPGGGGGGGEGTWDSGVPHCWQNLPVDGFSVPHLGHNITNNSFRRPFLKANFKKLLDPYHICLPLATAP